MIWFAIGFVLMVILSICSYWMGYSRYKKYDKEKMILIIAVQSYFLECFLYFL